MFKYILLIILLLHFADCNEQCKDKHFAKKNKRLCLKQKKGFQKVKFDNWQNWKDHFFMCNPINNPNLSPINIHTDNLIQVKDEQALIVYSGRPQAALYFYSTEYLYDNVIIQAVNMHSRKENFRDTTYIAGVGNPEYRYFEKALFLFTQSEVDNKRSLHQINGKKFMLEIVLTFADIRRSGQQHSDITQIHVMVEKSKTLYPGWKFLEEGMLGLNSILDIGIDSNAQILDAKDRLVETNATVFELQEEQKKELEKDTYLEMATDLKRLYELVADAEDTKTIENKEKLLQNTSQALTIKAESLKKSKTELQNAIESLAEEISRDIKSGVMQHSDHNEKTDKLKRFQAKDLAKTEDLLQKTILSLQSETVELWEINRELKKKREILRQYKIGQMEGAHFNNVSQIKEKMVYMQEKATMISNALEDFLAAKDSLETLQSQTTRDVLLANTPFQISWLLPNTGGYYRYNGSSVVPPCSPRTRVIVMENSIPMALDQFNAISKFTIKGRYEKEINEDQPPESMDKTIPILAKLGNRQIFYNKKNIQFKLDDAMHMKSKLRREIKDSMKKSAASTITTNYFLLIFLSTTSGCLLKIAK